MNERPISESPTNIWVSNTHTHTHSLTRQQTKTDFTDFTLYWTAVNFTSCLRDNHSVMWKFLSPSQGHGQQDTDAPCKARAQTDLPLSGFYLSRSDADQDWRCLGVYCFFTFRNWQQHQVALTQSHLMLLSLGLVTFPPSSGTAMCHWQRDVLRL